MARKVHPAATLYLKAKKLVSVVIKVVTVLFLVSFAGTSTSSESIGGRSNTVMGRITQTDFSHRANSLTLHPSDVGPLVFEDELNIFLNDKTTVLACEMDKSFTNLQVGDRVVVTYYENAGLPVADFIYRPCI